MRHLDLFSGIGGFALAFGRVGFETVAFCEVDPFACRALAHRWPDVPNLGDVTKIDGTKLNGKVDVITGGFPCQDLSVAGKRKGLRGERSGRFWHIIRLANETEAPWLVLENVPGLLSSNGGRDMRIVLDALGEAGYVVDADILDAQYFGVPQRRRRIFFVCERADSLAKRKSSSSALTIAQCLIELSLNVLGAARRLSCTEPQSLDSERTRCVDGIQKRMRLFGIQDAERRELLRRNLDAERARLRQGEKPWDCPSGTTIESLKTGAADRSGVSPTKMAAASALWSTAPSWKSILDDLSGATRSFTTSMPTSETTESTIYTCARAALSIGAFICLSSASSPSLWSAASCALTAIEEYTNYARRSTESLFSDLEWLQPWSDFIGEAEELIEPLRDIGERAGEILSIAEGVRRDTEEGREEGERIAPCVIKGAAVGREPERGPQYGEVLSDGTCYTLNTVETRCVSTLQGRQHKGVDAEGAAGGDLLPVADGDLYGLELGNQGSGGNVGRASPRSPFRTLDTNTPPGIAHALTSEGHDASEDGTGRGTPIIPFDTTQITSDKNYSNPRAGDPCHPLASGAHPPALAFALRGREEGARVEVSGEATNAIRGASGGSSKDYVAAPITASYGKQLDSSDTNQGPPNALLDGMAVRRLTPLECERLQGVPDFWTDIPGASDSARYRALGNAIAVPVVEWIARRLMEVAR